MDFLQHFQLFHKGDIQQAKWMIGIAIIILLPTAFLLFRSNLSMQKGMLIPLCLLIMSNIGYGCYVWYAKPKQSIQVVENFLTNPQQTITHELQKTKADHKSYTTLKYIWGLGIVVSLMLYFLLTKEFHKSIALGFLGLFVGFLLIDTFFSQRLNTYLDILQRLK